MHQPLGGVDEHGHAIPLEYQGAPVPKRMNQLGFGGHPVPGSLLTPDDPEEVARLEAARAEAARKELEARTNGEAEQAGAESKDRDRALTAGD